MLFFSDPLHVWENNIVLRKIMAAIAAAIRFVAKVVWVPMQVAGKLALMPFTVLEKVFGGSGGGAEQSAEDNALEQAHRAAQHGQQTAEKSRTAGDYAINLRGLARRRAESKEIDGDMWARLPDPLADYLKRLTLTECETLGKQHIKVLAEHLEGRLERIQGVRTPVEVLEAAFDGRSTPDARPIRALHPEHKASSSNFRSLLDETLQRARGSDLISTGKELTPSGARPTI